MRAVELAFVLYVFKTVNCKDNGENYWKKNKNLGYMHVICMHYRLQRGKMGSCP